MAITSNRSALFVGAIIGALFCARADAAEPLLRGAHRVLFLGDSITYAGQYVEIIEAYFVTRYPNRKIEVLNLGLPSETVSGLSEEGHADGKFPRPDLHERLERVMDGAKPDTVLACYGMNDGIYLPFDGQRFSAFTNGIVRLRSRVQPTARLIHITPPVFDEARGKAPGYANTLDRYSDWMLAQRTNGWQVIDLHGAMNEVLVQRRKADPAFHLAGDGVHPGDQGHWLMAKAILKHLGASDVEHLPDAMAMVAPHPHGPAILKLVQQKQRLLKDSWLTSVGHKRPGMNKGLPMAEAQVSVANLEKQIRTLAAAVQPRRPQ